MTDEVEQAGFEYVDDTGWNWEGMRQFFRIFYHAESRIQAAICFTEQHGLGFVYLSLTCRDHFGTMWKTWNFPFSRTMETSPQVRVRRDLMSDSFSDLLANHYRFLRSERVNQEDLKEESEDTVRHTIEEELSQQIHHNLLRGIIAKSGDNTFRYSWRGLFFLWGQFVKDMVKLS